MPTSFDIVVDVPHLNSQLLERLQERGLGLELSYFALPEHLEPKHIDQKLEEYRALLADFPYTKTLHGAFYELNICSREPKIRKICYERMIESLVIADELGMREVVFHCGYKPAQHPDWKAIWLDQQVSFWARMVEIAQAQGQVCLLENTTEPDPSFLFEIAERINSPHLKICLDTGHTRCFTNTKIPLLDWAQGLGQHLACIHLHTNRGQRDEHLAYNHPEGVLEFEPMFQYLEGMEQPPLVVIEVKTPQDYEASYEGLRQRLAWRNV